MAKPIPTTKIQNAALETRGQLAEIKHHHEAAEAAAQRGDELEAAGDSRGARAAYDEADAENDKANEIADVVQAKVGTNHTVNGDGTIDLNKIGGDKFDDNEFTRQETVLAETGLTAEQVVLAGPEAVDEAMVVVVENQAEAADRNAEDFIDTLLEDASIDPDLATDQDKIDVLEKEALEQTGVLDLVEANGGDPDAMTPEELEEAAVAAINKEAYRQDGLLDLVEAQGGDPDTMTPEELERAVERAIEAEENQQSTERDEPEPPQSREPVDDEPVDDDPADAEEPQTKGGDVWDLLTGGDGSSPPEQDVENEYDTPDGVDGDGGGKPGASAGTGSTEGTPGGDQAEPSSGVPVEGRGAASGTTAHGGSGGSGGPSVTDAGPAQPGASGPGAVNPVNGVTGTADEGGTVDEPPSTHSGDDPASGPDVGRAGIETAPDPFEGTGLGLDDPSVDRTPDTPHLDGTGGAFDDPLGAGSAPGGTGFGDTFDRGGGPSGVPSGADGLLGVIPDQSAPGSGSGGGLPGSGRGGGSGSGPFEDNAEPGENPLGDSGPGALGGGGPDAPGGAGQGASDATGGGGGTGQPTDDGSEPATGDGGIGSGGGAPGSNPAGSGGGGPSYDADGDSGMVKIGNFWYAEVEGSKSGAAFDTYVDESGNVWADGPNGPVLVKDDDVAKISEKLDADPDAPGLEELAEQAAANAEAAAAAAAAAEAEAAEDEADEDYAEPPPVASPYADDPLLNAYFQQEADAEAGADIDYGDQVGGLADAGRTVDVRPDQVDYGGATANPADLSDMPIEQAQSGLIDPSPMDEPVYGDGTDPGGFDQQSEIEADFKESQSGVAASNNSDDSTTTTTTTTTTTATTATSTDDADDDFGAGAGRPTAAGGVDEVDRFLVDDFGVSTTSSSDFSIPDAAYDERSGGDPVDPIDDALDDPRTDDSGPDEPVRETPDVDEEPAREDVDILDF